MHKKLLDWVLLLIIGVGLITVVVTIAVDIDLVPIVASVAASLFSVAAVLGTYMTVQEMRTDRIERNRPFVLVEFTFAASSAVYFSMRNMGTSIARNVRVDFEPSPIDVTGKSLSDCSLFKSPIPIMGPGTEYKFLFHVSHQLLKSDTLKRFDVLVEYEGELNEPYSNCFEIDFSQYMDFILPPKNIEEHLDEIAKQLKRISDDLYRHR